MKKENQLTKQTICFIILLVGKLDFKKGGDLGKIQNLLLEMCIPVREIDTQAVHRTVMNVLTPCSDGCLAIIQLLPFQSYLPIDTHNRFYHIHCLQL